MNKNMPIFTISGAKELIKRKMRLQLQYPEVRQRPIFLMGDAGCGKTAIGPQAASELSQELNKKIQSKVDAMLFRERPDFVGKSEVDRTGQRPITKFYDPGLIPTEGSGIWTLDEANRVDEGIRGAFLILLQAGEVNGVSLGREWLPVCTGNTSAEASDVTDPAYETSDWDPALMQRCAFVKVVPTVQEVFSYLSGRYKDHIILDYLGFHNDFLGGQNGISARTIEHAIKATLDYKDLGLRDFEKFLAVEIGEDHANLIANFAEKRDLVPTYEQILENPSDAISFVKKNHDRNDLISYIVIKFVSDLVSRISSKEENLFTEAETRNFTNFMLSVSPEHCHSLVMALNRQEDKRVLSEFVSTFIVQEDERFHDIFLQVQQARDLGKVA